MTRTAVVYLMIGLGIGSIVGMFGERNYHRWQFRQAFKYINVTISNGSPDRLCRDGVLLWNPRPDGYCYDADKEPK